MMLEGMRVDRAGYEQQGEGFWDSVSSAKRCRDLLLGWDGAMAWVECNMYG